MVDYNPNRGSFANILVKGNKLIAQSAMIKVGIPVGQMVWAAGGSFSSQYWLHGGAQILENTFSSGPGGYFGFMIGVSSTLDFIIKGNTFAPETQVGGVKTWACPGTYKG